MIDRSTNIRGALRQRQRGFIISPFRFGGGGGGGDPYFASVLSLLHFDEADGSTVFTDVKGKTYTASGGAKITTAYSVFGGSSADLSTSSSDRVVSAADAGDAFGTGDFTIEFRYRPASTSGQKHLVDMRQSDAQVSPVIYLFSGQVRYYTNSADRINSGVTLSAGTWYAIALARAAGITRLFIDGVQRGSSYSDSNSYVNQIISVGNYFSGGFSAGGQIDELRITKGIGRYAGSYTPAESQFPDS